MSQITDEMAQKILDWMESGEALVSEQLPVVVQQVIAWGWAENLTGAIASFFLFAISVLPFIRWYRCSKAYHTDGAEAVRDHFWNVNEPTGLGLIMLICGGLFTFSFGCMFLFEFIPMLLKLYVAPNLYVLEEMRAMAK